MLTCLENLDGMLICYILIFILQDLPDLSTRIATLSLKGKLLVYLKNFFDIHLLGKIYLYVLFIPFLSKVIFSSNILMLNAHVNCTCFNNHFLLFISHGTT